MKKIMLEKGKKGIEVWKLNRKGFYNFVKYITPNEIDNLAKEFKGYEILNRIKES